MPTQGATGNHGGKGLVSEAERNGFVAAVLAGELEPDSHVIAYHFSGWLDKAAAAASASAASAASASSSSAAAAAASRAASKAAAALDDAMASANKRYARTVEAIQAQRASFAPTVIPPSTLVVDEDDGLPEAESTPAPTPGAEESEKEEMAAAASDDVGSTTENVKLESVAAFIASYAGA
ncbi:unnamed protein product [Ectocarpus sp. CCAP 1310/34]|nr:unnamed protein product [Ectocarpus sp. CCAP 1310/34]